MADLRVYFEALPPPTDTVIILSKNYNKLIRRSSRITMDRGLWKIWLMLARVNFFASLYPRLYVGVGGINFWLWPRQTSDHGSIWFPRIYKNEIAIEIDLPMLLFNLWASEGGRTATIYDLPISPKLWPLPDLSWSGKHPRPQSL